MKNKKLFFLLMITSVFLPFTCFAEQEADQWYYPNAGLLTMWTAPLYDQGQLALQPIFVYNSTRGSFDADSSYERLPDSDKAYQYQEQLFLQYGITNRLEFDALFTYQQNYTKQEDISAHDAGWGDSYLYFRPALLEGDEQRPYVTGLFQLKMPTGKYQKADPEKLGTDLTGATTGGGSWDYGAGIIVTKELKPFIIHADFIYNIPNQVRVDDIKTRYADYINYDVGLEYYFTKSWNISCELNGLAQADIKQDGYRVPGSSMSTLTIGPGIGWSSQNIQIFVEYQRVLTGKNADATDSIIGTFCYVF